MKRELISAEHISLAWRFNVSQSACANPIYYNEYIRFSALADSRSGISLTHVFIDEDEERIAGFISLRASSMISESETGSLLVHPSLEIAELAVDQNYERRGVGREMLNFALLCADNMRKEIAGIKFIIVCSDPMAVRFYEKIGFSYVKDLFDIPRDGWNDNCIPMYIQLPEV